MVLTLIVGLAVTLSFVRFWLLPEINQFRYQLESVLSEQLQQPVHIHKLRASLYHFTPQLRLLGITLGDPKRYHVSLREIQVSVNLPACLKQRQLQIESIRLVGATIDMELSPKGRLKIGGLGGAGEGFPAWLLQDGHFELIDSTLHWHLPNSPQSEPKRIWRNFRIQLVNRGEQHHLVLSFHALNHWARQAWLHVRLKGDLRQPLQGRGSFRLSLRDFRLAPLQELLSPLVPLGPWRISKGQGRLDTIGKWQHYDLEAQTVLTLDDIRLQHSNLHFSIAIQRLDTRLNSRLTQHEWHFDTAYLRLQGKGMDLTSRLTLDKLDNEAPELELFTLITRLELSQLNSYLPSDPRGELATWLNTKPFRGRLSGRLLWRGRLTEYPFRGHNGVTEASLDGQDLTIRFLPDWPALEQADIHLRLLNDDLRVKLTQAKFAKATVGPATGRLKIGDPDPRLTIDAYSHPTLSQVFTALRRSPLKGNINNLTEYAEFEGQGHLHMSIDIPLRHALDTRIDGRADIQQTKIALKNAPLALTDIQGKLFFDTQQISTHLTGLFHRHPAVLTATAQEGLVQMTLQTHLNADELPASLPLRRVLQGESDLSVELVKQDNRPIKLTLQSDLTGTSIRLPPPLGKSSAARRPLTLTTWLPEADSIPLTLDYNPFHAVFSLTKNQGAVNGRVGINQPPPPPNRRSRNGIIVAGRLAHLELLPWLDALHDRALGKFDSLSLKTLDLEVGHLMADKQDLGSYRLRAQWTDERWEGQLGTPFGAGKWWSSPDLTQLDIRFESLDFDTLSELGASTPTTSPSLSFALWPAIHMNASRVDYKNRNIGALQLRGIPQRQKLLFDLKLAAPTHQLEASGTWQTNPQVQTRLQGRFTSPALADFLNRINHPTALADTPAQIDFDLHWPASPPQFSLKQLNGYVKLDLGPGRWLDVEPGAGRLFGLLYLGTLQRRLRLDFTDIFASGLSYDHIDGHIRMAGGRAFTDDLVIEAVPARIFINGSVDLVAHRTDELITVIPNTPLTLGLVGENHQSKAGKAAGLLQRMINTPLDSITQSQYAITGTWDDPVILRLRRSVPGTILHGLWSGFKKITGNHDSK